MKTKLFLLIASLFCFAFYFFLDDLVVKAAFMVMWAVFITGSILANELEYYLTAKHFDDIMQAKFEKENPNVA